MLTKHSFCKYSPSLLFQICERNVTLVKIVSAVMLFTVNTIFTNVISIILICASTPP